MTLSLAGLSLRDLEYAAAVDRTRHFGRAAVGCAVSPAALSEQLRKLEDRRNRGRSPGNQAGVAA
jgi:LysR family hydrogen peroxide-inducible transcriptional activator